MLAALRCPVASSSRRSVVPSLCRAERCPFVSIFRCFERVLRGSCRCSVVRTVCVVPPYASVFRRACGRGSGSAAFRDCFDDRMSRMREGDSGCGRSEPLRRLFQAARAAGFGRQNFPEAGGESGCGRPEPVPAALRVARAAASRRGGPQLAVASCALRRLAARHLRSPCAAAAGRSPAEEHVPQAAPRRPDTEIPAAAQCTSFRAAGTDFPRKLSYLCRYL